MSETHLLLINENDTKLPICVYTNGTQIKQKIIFLMYILFKNVSKATTTVVIMQIRQINRIFPFCYAREWLFLFGALYLIFFNVPFPSQYYFNLIENILLCMN